jgi:hypothetical protein
LPGLCSAWKASADFRIWRFTCRDAPAIAAELRRVGRTAASPSRWLFADAGVDAPTARTLVVRLPFAWRRFPYALTAAAAGPRGVPGPFRLVRGSPGEVVAERDGKRVVFRRLAPAAAVRAFRAGRIDEAPVPTGDADLLRERYDVRARELLALDAVVFTRAVDPGLRRAYRDTANRGDYRQLLDTSLALSVVPSARKPDPAAFRRALKAIPGLPREAVRIARAPSLDYGADILYGQWREAGLGPVLVRPGDRSDARFERLTAAYPQAEALPAALVLGEGLSGRRMLLRALARANQQSALAAVDDDLTGRARAIPVAWVTDERLVSRRLGGWNEDLLGAVDYARVTTG